MTAEQLIEELKRDADKGELLLWAAARGLTDDVTELIRTGADPRIKDKHGRQAAHYAASNGHEDILKYLSTKGVDLDVEDNVGRGALHYAAASGHQGCVSLLLAKGCWRDAPDSADDTPLHLAARNGNLGTIKALAEAGAKLALPNKRCLTPFAEAVLAGRLPAAEDLGGRGEGGLASALAATYREVPLLHLAAGLGQAAAVEWLVRQPRSCELGAAATRQQLTCLHAAALSGDADTVRTLLQLGADPLSQTLDGKLPFELVPKVAPRKAPPPPPPPGALPPAPESAEASAAAAAAADPALERSARRAFRALARAAAEKGGVELGDRGARMGSRAAAAGPGARGGDEEREEAEKEEEEEESPVVAFFRQFANMSAEEQVAKVESYARMDERQVQDLPYLDPDAQMAVTALRQSMHMVELFGAVAALRADEDFQSDIRDPRVRDALADVKRTNNLERYEDQAAVMSVAAKFKRLHAITRKTDGFQVVIDDLRAELPGNDPASTTAKMQEMRDMQRNCAANAVKAVLASAAAAVPEQARERLLSQLAPGSTGGGGSAAQGGRQKEKVDAGGAARGGDKQAGDQVGEEDADETEEQRRDREAREAYKARMAKLRAAATSTWTVGSKEDEDVGYVDRLVRDFETNVRKAEGAKPRRRWRLADSVGEEAAQSLLHTLRALLLTLAGFFIMWCFGLLPHQQAAALVAREEAAAAAQRAAERAAAAAAAITAAGAQLEGL